MKYINPPYIKVRVKGDRMNCPKCGNRLAWDDGAFCKLCMDIANEKSRQLQIAKKATNKPLALRRSKERR